METGLWDRIQVLQFSGIISNVGNYPACRTYVCNIDKGRRQIMLWTIAVILAVLWLLGMVSSYTMGGLIHILLVLAIIAVVINLIRGNHHD